MVCCGVLQDVEEELPTFNVSYKPQKISPKFEGSVRQLLHKKIRDSYLHPQVRLGRARKRTGYVLHYYGLTFTTAMLLHQVAPHQYA
jgi:hypothetical protein